MNYRLILRVIGRVLGIEAAFMIFPLIVSFIYGGGDHPAFLWPILITAGAGGALAFIKPKERKFRARDAFVVAGFSWILLSLFGALPFLFSGYFGNFIDCIFESVSGFTTTGSTILTDIEALPKGILFWRSFSHWIGGMGVLLFIMAVMPSVSASSVNLLRAESTGPSPDKIVPRIHESARIMYLIYLTMSVLLAGLLKIAGLPFFDALVNTFSVAGTGGFTVLNASVGGYNNLAAEIIMTVFMFLFGINFSLYFFLLDRKFKKFFGNTELKVFFGVVATSILIITANISGMYGGIWEGLRHASFQVSTIISTTGFSTADFALWPTLSQTILILLMTMGCCAGSTGGGIKLIRIIILAKAALVELGKIFHPGSVKAVTVNGKRISSDMVSKTALYLFIYFAVFVAATLLVSVDGKDILSSTTAVIASLSNSGPGLGIVGPAGNYTAFSGFSKAVLTFCMIAGRLEFYPLLVLFVPSVWRRS